MFGMGASGQVRPEPRSLDDSVIRPVPHRVKVDFERTNGVRIGCEGQSVVLLLFTAGRPVRRTFAQYATIGIALDVHESAGALHANSDIPVASKMLRYKVVA